MWTSALSDYMKPSYYWFLTSTVFRILTHSVFQIHEKIVWVDGKFILYILVFWHTMAVYLFNKFWKNTCLKVKYNIVIYEQNLFLIKTKCLNVHNSKLLLPITNQYNISKWEQYFTMKTIFVMKLKIEVNIKKKAIKIDQ